MKIGPIILLVWFLLVAASIVTAIVMAVIRGAASLKWSAQIVLGTLLCYGFISAVLGVVEGVWTMTSPGLLVAVAVGVAGVALAVVGVSRQATRATATQKRYTYHEAGHAVVNVLLGLPFEAVSMETARKRGHEARDGARVPVTFVYTEGVICTGKSRSRRNDELKAGRLDMRDAISGMAGPQAEAMVVGRMDKEAKFGARSDTNPIICCCRIASAAPGTPLEQLPCCQMENAIVDALAAQAKVLLRANWSGVEAVANALNSRKRLTRAEVEAIVEKHVTADSKGGQQAEAVTLAEPPK